MALITCSNCGKMVSDKAKACPHCGSPVQASSQRESNDAIAELMYREAKDSMKNGNYEDARNYIEGLLNVKPNDARFIKLKEQLDQLTYTKPASELQADDSDVCSPSDTLVNERENILESNETFGNSNTQDPIEYYYDESKLKKSNTSIIVAVTLCLLAILGICGWLWYDNQQKRIALEQLQEKARQNSIAHASIPLNNEAAVVNAASIEQPVASSSGVNMSLWGSIGEAHCKDFIMEGKTGYYQFEGKDNAKRILKLKSYDKIDGHCVLDAYLRGQYIGKFDGQYEIITGEHEANIYKGKFISVRSVKLDFYLYVD